MELTGKQKQYLKKEAHQLQPIFQIGKAGLSNQLIRQIDEALEKRELIKISLLQNTDEETDGVAEILSKELDAAVAQKIGRTIVLFRTSSKEKYQKISAMVKKV